MKKSNKKNIIAFCLILILVFFSFTNVCHAEDWSKKGVDVTIGLIVMVIVSALGWVIDGVVAMIISFAQYDDFVRNVQVMEAWGMVRDICNMFFILILLFIAFAVILRLESYNIKKSLPKLLMMAVLINFSRTICGIMIDFSQIVMLTFVNAFTAAQGNFHNVLQIEKFLSAVYGNTADTRNLDAADAAAYYIIGLIFMIVSAVVLIAILIAFVMRIVMFWIYLVLSPLAFLLSSFSAGQKYASQYWGEFTKYLINGPVLAFFIWMSLSVLSGLNTKEIGQAFDTSGLEIMVGANFGRFIMAIGMLVGGLIISAQIGGVGSSWGSNTVSSLKNRGISFAKKGAGLALKGGKNVGGWAVDKASMGLGVDLNVARGYDRLKTKMDQNKADRASEIEKKVTEKAGQGGRMAMLSHGALAWENFSQWRGGKGIRTFVKGGGIKDERQKLYDISDEQKKVSQARSAILSSQEKVDLNKEIADIDWRVSVDIPDEIKVIDAKIASTTDPDDLKKLKGNRTDLLKESQALTEQSTKKKIESSKPVDDARSKILDQRSQDLKTDYKKQKQTVDFFSVKGANIENINADSRLRSQGMKEISEVDSTPELVDILREAISDGKQGLISATLEKITKKGDYNDAMSAFGYGTSTSELQRFAKEQLYDKGAPGKMSEQSALSLLNNIGDLAKNAGHFSAYGGAVMEDGRWRKTNQDEAETMQLSEMLKMQPQKFAREIGRLGLGSYKSGDHSSGNWEVSKAAAAYLKLNAESLKKQYDETGQQSAIEYLAKVANTLERTYKVDAQLVNVFKKKSGNAVDAGEIIKNI